MGTEPKRMLGQGPSTRKRWAPEQSMMTPLHGSVSLVSTAMGLGMEVGQVTSRTISQKPLHWYRGLLRLRRDRRASCLECIGLRSLWQYSSAG